jgi:hypothetical protein
MRGESQKCEVVFQRDTKVLNINKISSINLMKLMIYLNKITVYRFSFSMCLIVKSLVLLGRSLFWALKSVFNVILT